MTAVNKRAVAAAFGRAAGHYAQHDELQRLSASLLLEQLDDRLLKLVLGELAVFELNVCRFHTCLLLVGRFLDEVCVEGARQVDGKVCHWAAHLAPPSPRSRAPPPCCG